MRKCMFLCLIFLCGTLISAAQDYPKLEVFTGYSYLRGRMLDLNLNGFDVSATGNVNSWFGVTADFGNHYKSGFSTHSFAGGPKFTYRGERINPYFQTMIGGIRMGNKYAGETGFVWITGGGIDIKAHKNVAIRAIDASYLLLRESGFNSSHGRLSAGVVWRFGIGR